MTELFDVPESLSPYAKWEQKHCICAAPVSSMTGLDWFDQSWADAQDEGSWCAVHGYSTIEIGVTLTMHCAIGVGATRDEAIAKLCEIQDIPLYGADQIKRKDGE
jgi:hypothetical protein